MIHSLLHIVSQPVQLATALAASVALFGTRLAFSVATVPAYAVVFDAFTDPYQAYITPIETIHSYILRHASG